MRLFFEIRRKEDAASYLLSPSLKHRMNSGKERNKKLTYYNWMHF